jgi:hypothetical protein
VKTEIELERLRVGWWRRFLCRIGWHDWSRWHSVKAYSSGRIASQSQTCLSCGFTRVKEG